jgi:hypothetical protein
VKQEPGTRNHDNVQMFRCANSDDKLLIIKEYNNLKIPGTLNANNDENLKMNAMKNLLFTMYLKIVIL